MKTVKEIATENGIMFEGGRYAVLSIDEMEVISKAYASQAIDQYAERTNTTWQVGVIEQVKSDLK